MCWQTVLALIFPCIPCKKLILKRLFLYHRSLIWSAWFWIWWDGQRYQRMNWLKRRDSYRFWRNPVMEIFLLCQRASYIMGNAYRRFCMGKMILWQHFRQWKVYGFTWGTPYGYERRRALVSYEGSSLPFLMTGWEVLSDSLRKRWWKSAGSQFAR